MASVDDLSPTLPYDQLRDLFFANCRPFRSVEQAQVYLHVAERLRFLRPEESEQGGERLRTRDLIDGIAAAEKYLAAQAFACQKPTVITATEL